MIHKDKLQHAAVGVIVVLFVMLLWAVIAQAGLAPMEALPAVLPIATLVAGVAKEGADWLDNKATPGRHEVSAMDALATFAPGLAAGLLVQQVLTTAAL